MDNDGDGLIDFPLDAGCFSAADGDEIDSCGQGIRAEMYPINTPFVLTNTGNGPSVFTGTCEAATGPEKIFVYDNPFSARLTFSVNHPETIARTNVYIREACADGTSELACDVGEAPEQKGTATIPAAPPGRYFVFVDHPFGLGGQVKLSLVSERLDPGCADGLDNDEDGLRMQTILVVAVCWMKMSGTPSSKVAFSGLRQWC